MHAWWEAIRKAIQHKYLRKFRKNGRWVYIYPEEKGSRHSGTAKISKRKNIGSDDEIHAGASYSAGQGKGHLVVEKVHDDGSISFYNDDIDGKKGATTKVSRDQFTSLISSGHADEHDRHYKDGLQKRADILAEAKQYGTPKHIERAQTEVDRWRDLHSEQLPATKETDPGTAQKKPSQEFRRRILAAQTREEAIQVRLDMKPHVEAAYKACNDALVEIERARRDKGETHAFSGDNYLAKEKREIQSIEEPLNHFRIRTPQNISHGAAAAAAAAIDAAHESRLVDYKADALLKKNGTESREN